MKKYTGLHPDVDYSLLHPLEYKFKASRDLFTIFYLTKNQGLTDYDIYLWAKKLNFTGYNGMTPECIVRSNIYRWNNIADAIFNKQCKKCLLPSNYGFDLNVPITCKKHREEKMILVIEERLYRQERDNISSKGKYFLDHRFIKRIQTFPSISKEIDTTGVIFSSKQTDTSTKVDPKGVEVKDDPSSIKFIFDVPVESNSVFNFDTMEVNDECTEFTTDFLDKEYDTTDNTVTIEDFFNDLETMWTIWV